MRPIASGSSAASAPRRDRDRFDREGRLVNTVTPSKGIATSEFNATNDVVRSLDADNRAVALKEGSKSAEVAEELDTKSTYSSDGTALLETLGPEHKTSSRAGAKYRHATTSSTPTTKARLKAGTMGCSQKRQTPPNTPGKTKTYARSRPHTPEREPAKATKSAAGRSVNPPPRSPIPAAWT